MEHVIYQITDSWITAETIMKYYSLQYKPAHKLLWTECFNWNKSLMYPWSFKYIAEKPFWKHHELHEKYPFMLQYQDTEDLRRHLRELTGKKRLSRKLTHTEVITMIIKA